MKTPESEMTQICLLQTATPHKRKQPGAEKKISLEWAARQRAPMDRSKSRKMNKKRQKRNKKINAYNSSTLPYSRVCPQLSIGLLVSESCQSSLSGWIAIACLVYWLGLVCLLSYQICL